jgi:hypothetical protein
MEAQTEPIVGIERPSKMQKIAPDVTTPQNPPNGTLVQQEPAIGGNMAVNASHQPLPVVLANGVGIPPAAGNDHANNPIVSHATEQNTEAQQIYTAASKDLLTLLQGQYAHPDRQELVAKIVPFISQMGAAHKRLGEASQLITTRASALESKLKRSEDENIQNRGKVLKDMVSMLGVFSPENEAELNRVQEHVAQNMDMPVSGFLRQIEPIITQASFRAQLSKQTLLQSKMEDANQQTNSNSPCNPGTQLGNLGGSLAVASYNDLLKQSDLQTMALFKQNPGMMSASGLQTTHDPHSTIALGHLNSAQRGFTQSVNQTLASHSSPVLQAVWPTQCNDRTQSVFESNGVPIVTNASAREKPSSYAAGALPPSDAWLKLLEDLPSPDGGVYNTKKADEGPGQTRT